MRTRKRVDPVETTSTEPADTEKQLRGESDLQRQMREDATRMDTLEETTIGGITVSERMEVEVTFGEELFTPAPYHSFRVGPFWAKGFTRAGESRMQAISRLSAELETVANEQREQRYRQYKAAVRTMYGDKAADAMFGTKR